LFLKFVAIGSNNIPISRNTIGIVRTKKPVVFLNNENRKFKSISMKKVKEIINIILKIKAK